MTSDHDDRIERAELSLEGLSLGDAFGQQFFSPSAGLWTATRQPPPAPWHVTDDTIMAIAIVDALRVHGRIDQDALAHRFAADHARHSDRGYGATAGRLLRSISNGTHWQIAAGEVFGNQGSMGNGAAMRAGPIGAYFADDPSAAVAHAIASAEVTHAHADGIAGAVAVSTAAATAAIQGQHLTPVRLFDAVIQSTPHGQTREGIIRAASLDRSYDVATAVAALGNGSQMLASDTVPLALWCVARHLDSFEQCVWTAVDAAGDRDTLCAIAGSVISLSLGRSGIPNLWHRSREPLSNFR